MRRTDSKDQERTQEVFETEADEQGPKSAGQSGDLQGLSNIAEADSQSVEELVEEGQFFEAAVISGVENALPADLAEVTTKEVPVDDVPPEYLETDRDVDPEA